MKSWFKSLLILIIFFALGGVAYVFFNDMQAPEITLLNKSNFISKTSNINLNLSDVSGIKSVKVYAIRGEQNIEIMSKSFPEKIASEEVIFTLKDAGLRDGDITIHVVATDASLAYFGMGNSSEKSFKLKLDSVAPRVKLLSGAGATVRRGSIGAISFSANKELERAYIKVNNDLYPAFKQSDGEYHALFPYKVELEPSQVRPEIIVVDLAGNVAKANSGIQGIDRKFKEDTLNISDGFLNARMPDFVDDIPDAASHLERYVRVNREIRVDNTAYLLELGKKTDPTLLSEGTFARLPRAANRATFGDKRTYKYNGEVIDNQTHKGIDLASVKHAEIPAANNGTIVYAEDLGIFGLMVLIDHGLGLMSLYSHLSEIHVNVGDIVKRGNVIGKTGVTGLAGGDHLHFGVLVHGVESQPLDWYDKNWIRNNITNRLK